MRFARTDFFKSDYKRLSKANQELFRQAAREFNEACDQFVVANNPSPWPAKLRVKSVVNAPQSLRNDVELHWTRWPSYVGVDNRH